LATEHKIGSAKWVEHINQAYASTFTNFVIHTNRTGFEDGVSFWGGSTVFDPSGNLVAQGPYYESALVTARLDLNQLRRTRTLCNSESITSKTMTKPEKRYQPKAMWS